MSGTSLLRTTNVREVFTNGTSDDPTRHDIADLQALSAGSWFLEVSRIQRDRKHSKIGAHLWIWVKKTAMLDKTRC